MSSFIEIKDANVQLIDGDRGTNYPEKSDFHQNGFCLFLDASNITDSGFDFESTHFISKLKDAQLKNGKLRRYDIVLMTRGSVGNVALYDDDIRYENIRINSGMLILRCENRSNAEKLLYLFRSKLIKTQISNLQSGSIQKQLPVVALKMLKIPKKWERSNVSILQALDKKITLNKQINAELEALAKTIYDYWFVQFDFPDENGKPYRTSGGAMEWNEQLKRDIPKGWKVKQMSDLADVVTGKEDANFSTPKGEYKFFTCSQDTLLCDTAAFEGHAVLIAGNGDFNVKHYSGKFNAYQRTYVLIPTEDKYYGCMYFALNDKVLAFKTGSNGSIVKFITKGDVEGVSILVAPQSSLYHKINSLIYHIEHLNKEGEELTRLRDWLLPMLMNGQATVE